MILELTLCADPSCWICRRMVSRSRSVSGARGVEGYDFTHRDLPPLYTYANVPIDFNAMLVLTVLGQSQSSVMTIGCEWISWIHGVQWPQSKQTGGRGPSLASCLSSDVPRQGRYPRYCIDWQWYVVGTWRENVARPLNNMVDRDVGRQTWAPTFYSKNWCKCSRIAL